MNTPVSLTSIATDIADLRVKSSKYITDYTVSLVVNENTDKDSDEKYIYSYLVKFNYCNMYTITGMLCVSTEDGAYTNVTGTVIPGAYLCDGKLYNTTTITPYSIKGYVEVDTDLIFNLTTFINPSKLFVRVKSIIKHVDVTNITLHYAIYDKLLNAMTLGESVANLNSLSNRLYPIIIENFKHECPCFVNVKEENSLDIDTSVLPILDHDLNLLKIPCFVIKEKVKQ